MSFRAGADHPGVGATDPRMRARGAATAVPWAPPRHVGWHRVGEDACLAAVRNRLVPDHRFRPGERRDGTMASERRDSFDGEFDAVVPAARAGAPWALERIYEVLSPAVAGLFRAQGIDDPDDLTSEVFVGVLRNLAWFD